LAAPAVEISVAHRPSVLDRLPAPALVLIAVFGFQLSSVIAKPAIQDAGPVHTAFLRALFGAIVLLAWRRPQLPLGRQNWLLVIGAGVTMLINTLVMYAAFERIPVGIAVAIGFWGPMTLALIGSHRALDVVWVVLAIGGILLFTPLADASFDSLGVLYAIIAGAGFGATLVFSSRLGRAIGGVPAAGMAMVVGTIGLAPLSIATGLHNELDSAFVMRMLAVGVVMSVFGFAVEYTALTRIRPSLYAVLISLEPAVGAILGFLILSETVGWIGVAGIAAVTSASLGASRSNRG
jgi:inner membrane transporter RhtA